MLLQVTGKKKFPKRKQLTNSKKSGCKIDLELAIDWKVQCAPKHKSDEENFNAFEEFCNSFLQSFIKFFEC